MTRYGIPPRLVAHEDDPVLPGETGGDDHGGSSACGDEVAELLRDLDELTQPTLARPSLADAQLHDKHSPEREPALQEHALSPDFSCGTPDQPARARCSHALGSPPAEAHAPSAEARYVSAHKRKQAAYDPAGGAPPKARRCRPPPSPPANPCLLYTSPSPRDATLSRMPSSA